MSYTVRKVLAIIIVLIIAFGWLVTVNGVGPIDSIKDRMSLGLDIKGGVYVIMEADKNDIKKYSDDELREVMEQTQTVIENRINANGLGEPTITIEGQNRLRVEIPEVDDPEEAIELIGATAKLQFMLADGTVVLEGDNVKNAEAGRDDQSTGYAVNLKFDNVGADKFGEATTKAFNGGVTSTMQGVGSGAIAIVLDGNIISAPNVKKPILGGRCSITGDFSQEEAQLLSVSSSGENTADKGIMARIWKHYKAALKENRKAAVMEAARGMTYSEAELLYGKLGTIRFDGEDGEEYAWSLKQYKSNVQKLLKEDDSAKGRWDELEKSIVANIASDVRVGVTEDHVKMVIYLNVA